MVEKCECMISHNGEYPIWQDDWGAPLCSNDTVLSWPLRKDNSWRGSMVQTSIQHSVPSFRGGSCWKQSDMPSQNQILSSLKTPLDRILPLLLNKPACCICMTPLLLEYVPVMFYVYTWKGSVKIIHTHSDGQSYHYLANPPHLNLACLRLKKRGNILIARVGAFVERTPAIASPLPPPGVQTLFDPLLLHACASAGVHLKRHVFLVTSICQGPRVQSRPMFILSIGRVRPLKCLENYCSHEPRQCRH